MCLDIQSLVAKNEVFQLKRYPHGKCTRCYTVRIPPKAHMCSWHRQELIPPSGWGWMGRKLKYYSSDVSMGLGEKNNVQRKMILRSLKIVAIFYFYQYFLEGYLTKLLLCDDLGRIQSVINVAVHFLSLTHFFFFFGKILLHFFRFLET